MRAWPLAKLAGGLAGSLLLAGCLAIAKAPEAPANARCAVGEPMVETRLYLGLSSPRGPVAPEAFASFIETDVVPRWEEGFTVLEGEGVWRSASRGVTDREPSRVLVRLHAGAAQDDAEIEAIRAAYVSRFAQDAVMRTDAAACVDF
jgi:hypothetical protein